MVRKKLTMKEFEEICKNKLSKKKFLFKTENQTWDNSNNSLRLNLVFDKIFVCIAPNRVCFSNNENKITLIYVKYIYIKCNEDDEINLKNDEIDFTVICDEGNDKYIEYNFLAS